MKNLVLAVASTLILPLKVDAQVLECRSVLECAREAISVALESQQAVQIAVPKGAVMAFNLQNCPAGWTPIPGLAGRVVVGAGEGNRDQNDDPLTVREVGSSGGAESHTLTISEMPAHSHAYQITTVIGRQRCGGDCRARTAEEDTTTGLQGGSQPHNNMPPFYVLTYCERQ